MVVCTPERLLFSPVFPLHLFRTALASHTHKIQLKDESERVLSAI